MTGFTADWLRLREPFDHQARTQAAQALDLHARLKSWFTGPSNPSHGHRSIVDLACGHGSTLRWLAPLLGGKQRWRLIDHDPTLLAAIPETLARWAVEHGHRVVHHPASPDELGHAHKSSHAEACMEVQGVGFTAQVTVQQLDLATQLPTLDLSGVQLLTASALLDLVSGEWLAELVRLATSARAATLFALNVDGQTRWLPEDPGDRDIDHRFAAHQLRDKGFGGALGPSAPETARQQLTAAGHTVFNGRSNWLIDAASHPHAAHNQEPSLPLAMIQAMIDGTAAAAADQDPGAAAAINAWAARRHAAATRTRLHVGHIDLLSIPPG